MTRQKFRRSAVLAATLLTLCGAASACRSHVFTIPPHTVELARAGLIRDELGNDRIDFSGHVKEVDYGSFRIRHTDPRFIVLIQGNLPGSADWRVEPAVGISGLFYGQVRYFPSSRILDVRQLQAAYEKLYNTDPRTIAFRSKLVKYHGLDAAFFTWEARAAKTAERLEVQGYIIPDPYDTERFYEVRVCRQDQDGKIRHPDADQLTGLFFDAVELPKPPRD